MIPGIVSNSATLSPTVGMPVFLTEPDGTSQSTVTDSAGKYQFAGLGIGSYTVSLAPGRPLRLSASLRRSSLRVC